MQFNREAISKIRLQYDSDVGNIKQKILPMTNRLNALVAKVGNKQYVSSE